MARWRLAAPHYLNVPGSTWEYKEVDRSTGRQKRTNFPVPQLLNPDDPNDWNIKHGKDEGEIIVTNRANDDFPLDIVFAGEATPDMVPLDDEARRITASLAPKWKHPIESLTTTYADAMLKDLSEQVEQVRSIQPAVQVEGMTDFLAAMQGMMKQNQELLAALVAKQAPVPARRTA